MNAETIREFVLGLPHVEETMQWGEHLLFWVGDKDIGGKMFSVMSLDGKGKAVLSLAAGQERFAELVEIEGIIPAPYSAHHYWVALERWDALPGNELKALLRAAHALIFAKLPARTKAVLAMEPKARKKLIAERKALVKSRKVAVRRGVR